ncbi:NUDIX domain-containing protein [Microbacterium fluvii]|uniref:NUDIX domain-containing protein n=1 Tax=Microbacterium fluvii TaxID=415215 RepID=A0ABW2HDL7_9MICO|nr:NUDIX domain-containing protein [Microbacterium fluvii]MCU4671171.1 NUDIX domain-containing protein [Microbacterium fluvii]
MTATPTPGPGAPDSELVYSSGGEVPLELWRGPVTLPSGLSYTGHALRVRAQHPGVVIYARHAGQVLLVRSWRPAVGRELWELPRGFGTSADAAAEARRELREETGLTASAARVAGSYVTDSTLLPGEVRVVVCDVDDLTAGDTDGEVLEARWVPAVELSRMVAAGELADAHSLAAVAVVGSEGLTR